MRLLTLVHEQGGAARQPAHKTCCTALKLYICSDNPLLEDVPRSGGRNSNQPTKAVYKILSSGRLWHKHCFPRCCQASGHMHFNGQAATHLQETQQPPPQGGRAPQSWQQGPNPGCPRGC